MKYKKENKNIAILGLESSLDEAKALFANEMIEAIVVLDKDKYVGLLVENEIVNTEDDVNLYELKQILKPVYLLKDYTLFDWFQVKSKHNLKNIPVVEDDALNYLGVINKNLILNKFKESGLNVENSTILILRKASNEFTYSEVFQIAEANDAKIFGSYINTSNEEFTEIILNLYHFSLNELLQSYRRYSYEVISFHEEDLHQETLKANSDYFSKYLTV